MLATHNPTPLFELGTGSKHERLCLLSVCFLNTSFFLLV